MEKMSHLAPQFVMEMMGFPTDWTLLPFLNGDNESIKAGGNAIVPQVVYQIFKAIDKYNQLNNQLTL
jgi:site-specific DNA-cytosine methylase